MLSLRPGLYRDDMPLINTETEFLLFFTQKIESSSYALSLKNTTLSFSASCHLVLVYFFGTEPVPRKPMHQVRVIQNKHRVPYALLNNMGHIQRHLFEESRKTMLSNAECAFTRLYLKVQPAACFRWLAMRSLFAVHCAWKSLVTGSHFLRVEARAVRFSRRYP
jgi:hypothetical protein